MFDRSRACGRYRISMLDRPDAVNIAVMRLEVKHYYTIRQQ